MIIGADVMNKREERGTAGRHANTRRASGLNDVKQGFIKPGMHRKSGDSTVLSLNTTHQPGLDAADKRPECSLLSSNLT